MIDPLHSLAFSIHSSPGVYALLLGSGVSTDAGIPTGWGITLDLVSKLAEAKGESTGSDPVAWYRQEYGDDPDYSELLNALAKTTAERQQLLRGYFEPVDRESDDSQGQPTAAHQAIAGLVAGNYIRVIVTTNFDRLLEAALAAHGVTPTVISTPEQIQGALPLIHTRCYILKLHGDYLDTRIRNTEEELSSYPDEYNAFLDRVFDDFGLVVCGWSADWDNALRSAFLRAPSRRFTTFWAAHGELTDSARALVDHRDASVIAIDGADKFFSEVWEQVQAIEQFSRPHPFSVEVAVARLKQYLSEPSYRIRLSDLVDETVERVAAELSSDVFSAQHRDITSQSLTARVRKYEAICSILLAMACVGGRWAEDEHFDIWRRAIQRLYSCRSRQGGMVIWLDMQRYPVTLLLYALGLGAVDGNRLTFLRHVLCTPLHDSGSKEHLAIQVLPPLKFDTQGNAKLLEGMAQRRFPMSDWMHNTLESTVVSTIRDPQRYTLLFDKLEILIALAFARYGTPFLKGWMPCGAFRYRYQGTNCERVLTEIRESVAADEEESPFVVSRLFGDSVAECEATIEQLTTFLGKNPIW